MGQALALWSPVVVSKLDRPYHMQSHYNFALNQLFRSIEDLKIKVKAGVARVQGLAVEASLRLDILCLVEGINGQMHLICREETVRNRIPFGKFDPEIQPESDLKYVLDIRDIDCQGELRNQELHLDYFIDFMIIATREQLVQISTDENADIQNFLRENLAQVQTKVDRAERENSELRRRIYFYERNVSSLKKGIQKAENHNGRLQQEISRYQDLIGQMQVALHDKEQRLQSLGTPFYSSIKRPAEIEAEPEELPLGVRIKRLFVNSSG